MNYKDKDVWKDVVGLEGRYEISSYGKLRNKKTGRNLDFYLIAGYWRRSLGIGTKRKVRTAHRMVAQSFIPNPNDLPEVNHKNRIKSDNRVENLEWCTKEQNLQHSLKSRGFKRYEIMHKKCASCKKEYTFSSSRKDISLFCSWKCMGVAMQGHEVYKKGDTHSYNL